MGLGMVENWGIASSVRPSAGMRRNALIENSDAEEKRDFSGKGKRGEYGKVCMSLHCCDTQTRSDGERAICMIKKLSVRVPPHTISP